MLGETGLVSVNLIKSGPPFCTLYIDQFPVGEGGKTESRTRQGVRWRVAHIAHILMFQQPIGDRHTAHSIFSHLNITLFSLHHNEGEISAPCSGGTFQKTVDFYLSVKHTFSTNYNSKLH